MGKGSNMYEEMDRIKRRIHQITEEYDFGVFVFEKGGRKPEKKHPTQEITQELECLCARLKELNKQDDKAVNNETTKIE